MTDIKKYLEVDTKERAIYLHDIFSTQAYEMQIGCEIKCKLRTKGEYFVEVMRELYYSYRCGCEDFLKETFNNSKITNELLEYNKKVESEYEKILDHKLEYLNSEAY